MNKTVLIVDDDLLSIEFMKLFLEGEGYTVLTASTFPDAVTLINENSLDILISDLQLEDASGADLIKHAVSRFEKIKTIIISGYSANSAQAEGEVKPDHHLIKPINLDSLLRAILN